MSATHQPVKELQIEFAVGDAQRVPMPLRDESAVPEPLAQARHEVVQTASGRRRRSLSPQRVDQAVARERLVGMEEQDRE